MNETRKAIIELIEPYMEKELSEGCLVIFEEYGNIEEIRDIAYSSWCTDYYTKSNNHYEIEDSSKIEILGHYNITAVLKYIDSIKIEKEINWGTREKGLVSKYKIEFSKDFEYFKIRDSGYHLDNFKFPNKPIHLYDINEEKDLLELLTKLKSYE